MLNVIEYRRDKCNRKWTIQKKLATLGTQDTRRRQAKQKDNTICVGHHYA